LAPPPHRSSRLPAQPPPSVPRPRDRRDESICAPKRHRCKCAGRGRGGAGGRGRRRQRRGRGERGQAGAAGSDAGSGRVGGSVQQQ
jgi:hypothetical protein